MAAGHEGVGTSSKLSVGRGLIHRQLEQVVARQGFQAEGEAARRARGHHGGSLVGRGAGSGGTRAQTQAATSVSRHVFIPRLQVRKEKIIRAKKSHFRIPHYGRPIIISDRNYGRL